MATPAALPIDLSALEAIVTDVDGTLYDQRAMRWRMLGALMNAHLFRPRTGWRTARCLAAFRHAQEELREGNPSNEPHSMAQYSRAQQATGYPAEFVRAAVARWMEHEPLACLPSVAFQDARPFFLWAAGRGLRLAAVSDYSVEPKLRALQLDDLFRVTVSPGDDPLLRFKPHPSMLIRALHQLGAPPERALYIGDRPSVDGAAARAANIRCVILSPSGPRGWCDGLWYVCSFAELQHDLEAATQAQPPE